MYLNEYNSFTCRHTQTVLHHEQSFAPSPSSSPFFSLLLQHFWGPARPPPFLRSLPLAFTLPLLLPYPTWQRSSGLDLGTRPQVTEPWLTDSSLHICPAKLALRGERGGKQNSKRSSNDMRGALWQKPRTPAKRKRELHDSPRNTYDHEDDFQQRDDPATALAKEGQLSKACTAETREPTKQPHQFKKHRMSQDSAASNGGGVTSHVLLTCAQGVERKNGVVSKVFQTFGAGFGRCTKKGRLSNLLIWSSFVFTQHHFDMSRSRSCMSDNVDDPSLL